MSRRRLVRIVAIAAFAAIAAACVPVTQSPPPPPPPAPPSPPAPSGPVSKTNLIGGLDKPWDISFVPGAASIAGSMLYTENDNGVVSVYLNSSQPRRMLIDIPEVNGSGEGGLMGIAVHPNYQTNHFVYVCYSTNTDDRVVRYTATLDGMGRPLSLNTPTPIITGIHHNDSFHQGCRIRFQPGTTNLFVTTGDNGEGTAPQDVNGLNGKVLRVTDAGLNPGNASTKLWYTRGHRNPQGIAFQPGSNVPYSGEHGPGIDDEINRLVDGGNAGWNPVPGYNQGVAMTDFSLGGDVFGAVWSSGNPTIALSGITFVSGSSWGTWSGDIIGAVLKDHELRRFDVDGMGNIVGEQKILDDGSTRLRVPVLGPDGALYVATDVASPGGQIWRVTKN